MTTPDAVAFDVKAEWNRRPWWLNVILLFCIYMTVIYSPFDVLFKPVAEDEDVWLGYVFHGMAAKVGGGVHWIVYAALAWGIWRLRPWAWWLASLYATQVALAMFLWPLFQTDGSWIVAVVAGGLFAVPAVALWRSRTLFAGSGGST